MDLLVPVNDLGARRVDRREDAGLRSAEAPSRGRAAPRLHADDGSTVHLHVERWHGDVDDVESMLLATLGDPVLDIGCGPGRIGAALTAAGRTVLGIDPAPTAIAWAQGRGAPALCRSVFDRLPDEGRWASALLLDGNIGIGGDPSALLARVCELLAPGGEVVAEVTAPGNKTGAMRVQLRSEGPEAPRPWFPWARVSADAFPALARGAGLVAGATCSHGDRWFARANRP